MTIKKLLDKSALYTMDVVLDEILEANELNDTTDLDARDEFLMNIYHDKLHDYLIDGYCEQAIKLYLNSDLDIADAEALADFSNASKQAVYKAIILFCIGQGVNRDYLRFYFTEVREWQGEIKA